MKILKNIVCLTLVMAVASTVIADEKTEKKRKRANQRTPKVTQRFVGKIDLTDAQKGQVAEIDKKFADKAKELFQKRQSILTADQKKAQQAAQKAAKEAKKSGAEARKDVQAALKLTDEQKTKMKDLAKLQAEFSNEVLAALKKVLTAEQQEKLPKRRGAGRKDGAKKGEGKKKKKKDAKKDAA